MRVVGFDWASRWAGRSNEVPVSEPSFGLNQWASQLIEPVSAPIIETETVSSRVCHTQSLQCWFMSLTVSQWVPKATARNWIGHEWIPTSNFDPSSFPSNFNFRKTQWNLVQTSTFWICSVEDSVEDTVEQSRSRWNKKVFDTFAPGWHGPTLFLQRRWAQPSWISVFWVHHQNGRLCLRRSFKSF